MLISLATLLAILSSIFRSRAGLQLENLALRHQIGVLRCAVANRRLRPGGHSLRIMPSSWSPSTSSPCPRSASRSFTCFWSWPMAGAHSAFQCDRSPNRGVDGTATAGGISTHDCPRGHSGPNNPAAESFNQFPQHATPCYTSHAEAGPRFRSSRVTPSSVFRHDQVHRVETQLACVKVRAADLKMLCNRVHKGCWTLRARTADPC